MILRSVIWYACSAHFVYVWWVQFCCRWTLTLSVCYSLAFWERKVNKRSNTFNGFFFRFQQPTALLHSTLFHVLLTRVDMSPLWQYDAVFMIPRSGLENMSFSCDYLNERHHYLDQTQERNQMSYCLPNVILSTKRHPVYHSSACPTANS